MQLKLNISIDDVNPKKGWRIIGEPTQKYLEQLHEHFGCKTTLFIPTNHHGNASISENKSWLKELADLKFIEFGAHGHYHKTDDPGTWGECEFGELDNPNQILNRIQMIMRCWNDCDLNPKVWKSPGWLTSREAVNQLSTWFPYAVVHPQHNHNLMWKNKVINATDYSKGLPSMDCNIFILTHIFGNHDNTWNDNFYNWVYESLEIITKNIPTEMSFIKEF